MKSTRLIPGIVDRSGEHIELLYGDAKLEPSDLVPVALVAPGQNDCFIVQHTIARDNADATAIDMLEEVEAELRYFLIEKHEPDPWAYAVYHCSTASNWHSNVHWAYHSVFRAS